MLNQLKQTQAQFGGTNKVIDHWLETRQHLIIQYCELAAIKPQASKTPIASLPSPEELQYFCQHLVDYISEGHFKIYDMVMKEWKSIDFTPTDEINTIYFQIVDTNGPLLDYTDKYANINEEDILEHFENDLSELGQVMVDRFDLEDQLIQLILNSLHIE